MSATMNWAYKPGVINKYNFTVPAGADNVRPAGWCYVALYGNDITGNGSRLLPYRTITKASTIAGAISIVLGGGVYREAAVIVNVSPIVLIGDGDVIIDASYNGKVFNNALANAIFSYNLVLKGDGTSCLMTGGYSVNVYDSQFLGCAYTSAGGYFGDGNIVNSVFSGISSAILTTAETRVSNCTFVNCNSIDFGVDLRPTFRSNVFKNCNVCASPAVIAKLQYSLFYQCNFRFTTGGAGGVLYPAKPAGYNYYDTIAALQAAYFATYAVTSFYGSSIGDPLFNNDAIGDYTLSFNSPAKNLSYFGTVVGARSIAYPLKIRASEAAGDFDFSSSVNLVIADNSIRLDNELLDGQIETNVISNVMGRELTGTRSYGFNADRNGQYIDSIADLSATTKAPGDAIAANIPWLVENGSVTYNGSVYTAGSRFTSLAAASVFTSSTGGVLREILEAPQRHTIMAKVSQGHGVVASGDLINGQWYFVTGSVTYNAVVYTNKPFKATSDANFTGAGSVVLIFTDEVYQHYEPGIKPTSNNVGDSRTGNILRGNGDPDFVRSTSTVTEFPLNPKFIQVKYIIRRGNLKP